MIAGRDSELHSTEGYHKGMNLSEDTRGILDKVERLTGKPAHLLPDPTLPTLARVTAAQGPTPAHIIAYKPDAPGVDYHVAYQCGFVLRLYQVPPEERYGFGDTREGRESVRKLLSGSGGTLNRYGLPASAVREVTDQMFDGLMLQLRSIPIGMRIDDWLWRDHPGLQAEQRRSIGAQQALAAQALGPQVREMTPPPVFSASAAMNAAYALFCDRLLGTQAYAIPYRAVGLTDRGQVLLELWDKVPAGADQDRELVDVWGEELGLSDWYRWVPIG